MESLQTSLGGPQAVMPIGTPDQVPQSRKPEGLIDLTKPNIRPMPEKVDPFGPPSEGQEGYEAFRMAQAGSSQMQAVAAQKAVAPIPTSIELDIQETPPATEVVAKAEIPDMDPEANIELTMVTFMMQDGIVRVSYPMVIENAQRTCLVLAAKDPPPGAALFQPARAAGLDVVVGEGSDAVRYRVVSFDASFKFGPWNIIVLAIESSDSA